MKLEKQYINHRYAYQNYRTLACVLGKIFQEFLPLTYYDINEKKMTS